MMRTPPPPTRTLWQRIRFVLVGTLLALALLLIAAPVLSGAFFIATATAGRCYPGTDPASDGLHYEAVTFPSFLGGETPAYLIHGAEPRTGGTIIMAPTLDSSRGYHQHEYIHYVRAGYDVLSFDSVNCLGAAVNSLGAIETAQIGDALAFLQARGAVMTRIAVHGFSAGGATAIMAAARYPQIGAVIAEGGYHDFFEHMRDNTGRTLPVYGALFDLGARAAYRLIVGQPIEILSPIRVIGQIAPRPVLLVYGSTEPALYGAYLQQQAGGPTVTVWEVPGAGHGDYAFVAPDEYPRRVVGFVDQAFGIAR
ncbi:MAG: alpha/beta hydrolase family protein [Candidatus Flexifilum sp.]